MNQTTSIDTNSVVSNLSKLEPGLLPKDIFYAVARLVVTPTYVVIPFYEENNVLYVHMDRRSLTDNDFAGMLCPVGKIILASDGSLQDTFNRLWVGELSNAGIKEGPHFVNVAFDKIPRGKEISLVSWVLLDSKPIVGELFDVSNLPEKEVPPSDFARIIMAIEDFKKNAN